MSDTETLIKALRILSRDIESCDGVANAAIAEAADRLQEQQDRIKLLEDARNDLYACFSSAYGENHHAKRGYE